MGDGTCEVKVSIVGMEPFAAFLRTVCDVHRELTLMASGPVCQQVAILGRALADLREATTDDEGTSLLNEVNEARSERHAVITGTDYRIQVVA